MTTRSRITLFLAGLLVASTAAAGAITDVRFQNTGAAQAAVPVTFGQVFAAGDVKKSDVLVGTLDGATVPLQSDVKATYADGSVRHAIISVIVPKLAAGSTGTMALSTGGAATAGASTPADLLATGFTASVSTTINGIKYTASADQLLKDGTKATWLAGAVANEWLESAPLTTADGVAHPHLSARFAIRYYAAVQKARVDVAIENDWAYEPGPQNFTYDAEILVGGKSVYTKAALTHLHHARWHKVLWWGDAPAVNVQANTKYLIASKAVPNYDQSVSPSDATLAGMVKFSAGGSAEPMTIGLATAYMPTTGAHDDIGILPMWQAAYVLSMDVRARDATTATGDGSGSFSVHYRDRATDRPVSLSSYPYMTIDGRSTDTYNPVAKRYESFPGCAADCSTPYTADTGHHPSLAYLPYLATGDYYYLEEMQFWALYNILKANPGYRGYGSGLVISEQLRGQAWALRTLAQAAAFTPDADPLKADLVGFMNNNLDWYNGTYTNNATANKLGIIVNGFSIAYNGDTGTAPWMDDFFTSAIGYAVDLGFDRASPLLTWKAKFPVSRMTAPGLCWVTGAPYSLTVRDTSASPFYDTLLQSYVHDFGAGFMALPCAGVEMAAAWAGKMQYTYGATPGDMGNISTGYMGYPSNMQPALAYAVDGGAPGAQTAWTLFMNRAIKPDYSLGQQFDIVPRNFVAKITPLVPPAPLPTAPPVGAPTSPGTWAKIANENAVATVPSNTIVRYGAPAGWIYAKVSGSFTASNTFFGGDPLPSVIKTAEAFMPTAAPPVASPPAVKPGKVTTPSNTKLKSLKGLTLTFFGPATLAQAKVFTGVTASAKGVLTVTDAVLVPGTVYGVIVLDASGKVLDILFPITAL